MRDFDTWFKTFRDSIYTYDFFTDFKKVYDTNFDILDHSILLF